MAQIYTDPVCGMQITRDKAQGQSTYQSQIYYFCSMADKEEFDRNPEKYVTAVKEQEPMVTKG